MHALVAAQHDTVSSGRQRKQRGAESHAEGVVNRRSYGHGRDDTARRLMLVIANGLES